MQNPVTWFEIYVNDMARARKFYEAVFKIKLQPMESEGGLQMLSFPASMEHFGATGTLVHKREVKAGGNSTLVYFHCEDCAVEEGRVAAAGGKVHKSKWAIGTHGFIALVVDTEGNMLGLHSR